MTSAKLAFIIPAMVRCINLYIDDSGARNPDHKQGRVPAHKHDYFSFGGVLIQDESEFQARQLHQEFCEKWKIKYALHSTEIRAKSQNFHWINDLDKKEQDAFYEELYQIMAYAPLTGIACVIDRPGYDNRYREKYGRRRWHLCKTAFCIVIERAAKYALAHNAKLRVNVERCNKKDDKLIRKYYEELKSSGLPFDSEKSSLYNPLSSSEFSNVLYDLKFKYKSSPMIQYADLIVWPMALGGYDKENRPYKRLIEDKKLIDCLLSNEETITLGIKYSCFKEGNLEP